MEPSTPAIIVVAYNRIRSIRRLLASLDVAQYPQNNIPLIISVDGGGTEEVREFAENFSWKFGVKTVLCKKERVGLKEHILQCGDLSYTHGSIIVLEDDLVVSPHFYNYALEANSYYFDDDKIAGVSLYSYRVSEDGFFPFDPVHDGADVYFMQMASSWGQLWTANQWKNFRKWYEANADRKDERLIPDYLSGWTDRSWKKQYVRYLIATDRYFVFPRAGLSTNFEDPGEHVSSKRRFQIPLIQGEKRWLFTQFNESRSMYDAWFEPTQQTVKSFTSHFNNIKFDVCLNGVRAKFEADYVLTTRKGTDAIKTFGNDMTPSILNVIHDIPGNDIGLYSKENLYDIENPAITTNATPNNKLGFEIIIEVKEKEIGSLSSTLKSLLDQGSDPVVTMICANGMEGKVSKIAIATLSDRLWWTVKDSVEEGLKNGYPRIINTDVCLFISCGDKLLSGALAKAERIFNQFKEISVLCDVPENELICNHRWNTEIFLQQAKNGKSVPTLNGLFLRAHVLKSLKTQPINLVGLLDNYRWITCCEPLVELVSSRNMLIAENEKVNLDSIHLIPNIRPYWRIMATSLLRSYRPDSDLYTLISDLPDLLRFDQENHTYYWSRL